MANKTIQEWIFQQDTKVISFQKAYTKLLSKMRLMRIKESLKKKLFKACEYLKQLYHYMLEHYKINLSID